VDVPVLLEQLLADRHLDHRLSLGETREPRLEQSAERLGLQNLLARLR